MSDAPFSLVFHRRGDDALPKSDAFTPAIKAVLDAAPGQVRLVSPYIGHGVLTDIIGSRDFRLITDIDECFANGSTALLEFLSRHHENVRDVDEVHAKVVLTDGAALVGSANLTKKGFGRRDEMSCLIRDPALLDTLNSWFEDLWKAGATFDVAAAQAAMQRGQERAEREKNAPKRARPKPPRPPRTFGGRFAEGPQVSSAREQPEPAPERAAERQAEASEASDNLVARLRTLMRTGDEAQLVLDSLAEALAVSKLESHDTRLYVNCRAGTGIPLQINISSLAVAWLRKKRYFGMMLDDRDLVAKMRKTVDGVTLEDFKAGPHLGINVPLEALADVIKRVRASWHGAIRTRVEIKQSNGGSFVSAYHANYHFPFFYDLLMDRESRNDLVRRAFPSSP